MDISALLSRIKENIKTIEGGDTRFPLLDEVRSDFLEMIELIKLFMISERDSYYGYFMMNMQFRANFGANSIACIKLNEFPAVFESNPLLLCKFSLKEIIYIVCHEIDHVVLNHPAEMVKSNPEGSDDLFHKFNLAADASVNDRINHEIKAENHNFMSQPEGAVTSAALKKKFKLKSIAEMESYAYYFELIRDKKDNNKDGKQESNSQDSMLQQKNKKGGKGPSGEDGEGRSSKNSGKKADTAESADAEGGNGKEETIVTAKNCGKLKDHDWEAGNDADDATAAARELVNASVSMMSNESRGLMPGYFMSEVEEINKPRVLSWQKILKKYVGTISANKTKTRMRLNRRQPERFDLSGSKDDKVLKIVVAIDTSGSVGDEMIAMILNEVFAILAKRKHEVTVIECDSKIEKVYRAKTPKDIQHKVAGRGGTSFTPVIEYINENRYFRDALLIYFTDGYGDFSIPRPMTYRNIWVILGNGKYLSVEEPYGVVLTL